MATAINKNSQQFLYQQVIDLIHQMESSGTLNAGDKLPSLRKLSTQLGVSVPTVKQAYEELERLNKVITKEKSGYYLKSAVIELPLPKKPKFVRQPVPVRCQTLIEEVYEAIHLPNSLPLGISHPVMLRPQDKVLARIMRRVLSQKGVAAVGYGPMDGYKPLKRQLVQRYLEQGIRAKEEDIIITNGAQEALAISLKSIANEGDIIAVESPTYFGILELIENLGMMALEIPICSQDGICLDDLAHSLNSHSVKACLFSSLINNPTGACMPEHKRRQLVELVEAKGIPLIEDDVYGELHFCDHSVLPLQSFSTKDLVITCSSFSKTVAPSYRVGWILGSPIEQKAKGLKRALSCSTSLLNQMVLTDYIRSGDFARNLKRLRQLLAQNKERMLAQICHSFPKDTCVSNPQGGGVLWLEFPAGFDTTQWFRDCVSKGISITPGSLFSASGKYKRCARISYGLVWNDALIEGVKTIGQLAQKQIEAL